MQACAELFSIYNARQWEVPSEPCLHPGRGWLSQWYCSGTSSNALHNLHKQLSVSCWCTEYSLFVESTSELSGQWVCTTAGSSSENFWDTGLGLESLLQRTSLQQAERSTGLALTYCWKYISLSIITAECSQCPSQPLLLAPQARWERMVLLKWCPLPTSLLSHVHTQPLLFVHPSPCKKSLYKQDSCNLLVHGRFFLLIIDGKDCCLTDLSINMFPSPTETPNESLLAGRYQPVRVESTSIILWDNSSLNLLFFFWFTILFCPSILCLFMKAFESLSW